jgi:asparagine synthase (glutamine-hydrolysing)
MILLTGAFTAPDAQLPNIFTADGTSPETKLFPGITTPSAALRGHNKSCCFCDAQEFMTFFCGSLGNLPELCRQAALPCGSNEAEVISSLLCGGTPLREVLPRLNGGFVLARLNRQSGEWQLGRDRWGKMPLHRRFRNQYGTITFSTSPAALADEDDALSRKGLAAYLHLGVIPAPFTIYQEVSAVPAASIVSGRLGSGEIRTERWWNPTFNGSPFTTAEDAADALLPLLRASVERALNAPGTKGMLLSGGIDSGIIAAVAAKYFPDSGLSALTLAVDGNEEESRLAALTAAHLKMPLKTFRLQPEMLPGLMNQVIAEAGVPFGNSSLAATAAAMDALGTDNVLMGDGGDELFGGYRRYQAMLLRQRIPAALTALMRPVLKPLAAGHTSLARTARSLTLPPLQAYTSFLTITGTEQISKLMTGDDCTAHLDYWENALAELGVSGALRWNMLDLMHYLPDDGCRKLEYAARGNCCIHTPMLDNAVGNLADELPQQMRFSASRRKIVLRALASRLLPPEILSAPKRGFGIPVSRWLRNELAPETRQLPEKLRRSRLQKLLSPEATELITREHLAGRADHGQLLWALMCAGI